MQLGQIRLRACLSRKWRLEVIDAAFDGPHCTAGIAREAVIDGISQGGAAFGTGKELLRWCRHAFGRSPTGNKHTGRKLPPAAGGLDGFVNGSEQVGRNDFFK